MSSCIICLEDFSLKEQLVYICNYNHIACKSCLRRYLDAQLHIWHQKGYTKIRCPNFECTGVITTVNVVDKVFSKKRAEKWWEIVTKRTCIINKMYCPLEDCGAIFEGDESLKTQCTFTVCKRCNRAFCSACQSKWHGDGPKRVIDVELEKQSLKKAKDANLARCPKCGSLVHKIKGCLHMYCYCGTVFCYNCSRLYSVCKDTCLAFSQAVLNELRDKMFQ